MATQRVTLVVNAPIYLEADLELSPDSVECVLDVTKSDLATLTNIVVQDSLQVHAYQLTCIKPVVTE